MLRKPSLKGLICLHLQPVRAFFQKLRGPLLLPSCSALVERKRRKLLLFEKTTYI